MPLNLASGRTAGAKASGLTAVRRSRLVRWDERVTRRWVCVVVVSVSLVLLGWSVAARRVLAGHAVRGMVSSTESAGARSESISPASIADLRRAIESTSTRLVTGRAEFRGLLSRVEEFARQRGLRIDLTVSPPTPGVGGLEELTAFPATAQLAMIEGKDRDAYLALTGWLEDLAGLPRRAEVTSLRVNGTESGFLSAKVEFRFLGQTAHDEAASP
ncbi:MAG: hypothetical protein ACYC23_17420 [Limisphaerales bacterium]